MIGRTLSHYRIVDEIGAGGMGVVYRATDGRLDRSVALKVLPADAVADAVLRQRFLNEARAASALNHPNIVTIYDVVQDDGIDAIVMELVDGISLRERLNRGRLSTGDALNVARQLADALAAAHRAGIVHRDLKPANIIVSERGQAKVLDFGIAKLEFGPTAGADDTRLGPLTVAGTVLGTAAYMSPEQARGESIDGRTDIFALGVVLYEMLTRKAPFAAPTLAGCLQKLVNEDPAPLTSFGVEVPPAVEATIRRALAKSPGERFQTMDAMFEVLDTLASGGTPAVSSVAPARAAEPARRRRPLMATLAVVVIALTGAAVAYQAGWFTAARPAGDLATLPLPSTPFEAFERGQALLARYDRDGYIDQGIESFRRALSLRQDYPAALAGLGLAYWRKYREERDPLHLTYAFQHATQAMALDPHLTLAAVSLASAEIERGELDQADTRLADALVRNPGDADVLSTQAYLRLRQRRVDDAIATIRQAVATRATDWSLPLMEGVFLMAGGRPVEAVAALKGALTLAPDSALVLRNLGAAHYAADQYPEAASAFQGALQIKPDPAVYSNLGTLQFARGLYQDAVEAFDRAVKLGANDYRRWSNLADALRLTPGRMDDARKAYGTALQLLGEQLAGSPGDIDLTTRRVVMLAKSGNCGEALSAAGPLRAPSAKRPAALYRLGVALEVCDRRDDALAVVTQAVTAGWSLREVQQDPEMVRLRADARFHQFVSSLPRPPERSPAPHP